MEVPGHLQRYRFNPLNIILIEYQLADCELVHYIFACRVVRATKMAGSSSDDWIY
jgi:hypothetical protein